MVILMTGADSYRMHERMHFLRSAFEKKFSAQNPRVITITGAEATPALLHTTTQTQGLFTQKTCVIVSHAEEVASDMRESVEHALRATPEDVVVLVMYTPPKKGEWKTLPAVAQKTELFAPLSDAELRAWIVSAAKKNGIVFKSADIEHLLLSTEKNLWSIAHVLHQLKHLPAEQRSASLTLMLPSVATSTVFTILDAISEKNIGKALRALEEQLNQDSSVHGLITLIAKHLGLLYHVKATPQDPSDAHPFAVQKATVAAKRFSLEELRALLRELLNIDTQLKSTTLDERALMSLFLTQACQK